MEIARLRSFVAIVDEGSFTLAAERKHVAQPAVSQQIARLEADLGERLFDRRGRTVTLTQAGHALLPHARAILSHVDHARQDVAAISGVLTGRLTIGLVQPLPDRQFLHWIGRFRRAHPGIELTLVEDETAALLSALRNGSVDLCLIGLGRYDPDPSDLDLRTIANEHVIVAVHPDHPLAGRDSVTLRALRNERIVTLTEASKLRTTLDRACRDAGFIPDIAIETSHLDVMIALTIERLGIAILPESALPPTAPLTQVELTRPRLERRLLIASPPTTTTPAVCAFLDLVDEHQRQTLG